MPGVHTLAKDAHFIAHGNFCLIVVLHGKLVGYVLTAGRLPFMPEAYQLTSSSILRVHHEAPAQRL